MTTEEELLDQEVLRQTEEERLLDACKLKLPNRYLSVSQVVMYLRCGLSYQYRYVDGLILMPNVEIVEGSAIHTGLEHGLREYQKEGKPGSFSAMTDAWNEKWKSEKPHINWCGASPKKVERELTQRGKFFLGEYYKHHLTETNPVSVEEKFLCSMGEDNVPVKGYIDLIDDQAEGRVVVDHKVVGVKKSQNMADGDLQLTAYAFAAKTDNVQFNSFVRTKQPKIEVTKSKRTVYDLMWAEKVFTDVARAISAGVFMPCDPGNWICNPKWCGYWSRCRRQ